MKNLEFTLPLVLLFLFLLACKKDRVDNFSVFKETETMEVTQDTIFVSSTETKTLFIDSYFQGTKPTYIRKINNNTEEDISNSSDITILKHGWDGRKELNFKKVKVITDIASMNLSSGATITISVALDPDEYKSVVYKVI